ncbi:hypothetical protein D3C76_1624740 [compost metagenome]
MAILVFDKRVIRHLLQCNAALVLISMTPRHSEKYLCQQHGQLANSWLLKRQRPKGEIRMAPLQ